MTETIAEGAAGTQETDGQTCFLCGKHADMEFNSLVQDKADTGPVLSRQTYVLTVPLCFDCWGSHEDDSAVVRAIAEKCRAEAEGAQEGIDAIDAELARREAAGIAPGASVPFGGPDAPGASAREDYDFVDNDGVTVNSVTGMARDDMEHEAGADDDPNPYAGTGGE